MKENRKIRPESHDDQPILTVAAAAAYNGSRTS